MILLNKIVENQDLLTTIQSAFITVFVAGGLIFLIRIIVKKLIDRYFEGIDKRNKKLDCVSDDLVVIMSDLKQIVSRLDEQARDQNKLKEEVKEKIIKLDSEIDNKIHTLEIRFKLTIDMIKRDLAALEISDKEHYNEIKGKITKQWDDIFRIKSKITEIEADHKHNHPH